MKFNWKKQGVIFDPASRFDWMMAYSQVPTVLDMGTFLRIFFTCRPKPDNDGNQVSLMSYIDVDRYRPENVLYIHMEPIMQLGGIGTFDEFGQHPCFFIREEDRILFYYQGWTRMKSVPYATSIGLAISEDGGNSFQRFGAGPLFSRKHNEPFLENGFYGIKTGHKYYMWYATCKEWINTNDKLEPVYTIVQAESDDGIEWRRNGREILSSKFEKEANGRPCVIELDGIYHMWFCYRNALDFRNLGNGAYRIGYATSRDLINWERNDHAAGIDVSDQGWDSEMVAYPYIYREGDTLYLFYNGNEFGKHGFGYAICKL